MNNIKEIIKLMPPRDSYPRMLVSSNGVDFVNRIMLGVEDCNPETFSRCVHHDDENEFLSGRVYRTVLHRFCKPIKQPSAEPWTDRFKIMNWCHHQKEVVLVVNTCDCDSEDVWNQYCFDEDCLVYYKWNKINPETNELMYSESKVFCDKECL